MNQRLWIIAPIFVPNFSAAQEMMSESCAMCNSMGWMGMILVSFLVLAIVAVLIALAIFLIRRSRSPSHRH